MEPRSKSEFNYHLIDVLIKYAKVLGKMVFAQGPSTVNQDNIVRVENV